jgi:peptide/nickel transport system substrate-binding protein
VFAACGSGVPRHDPTSADPQPRVIQSPLTDSLSAGRRGGTLTLFSSTGFGSIDPGAAHSELDYEVMDATQRPLFSYKPNTLAEASPDLATGPAEISSDGMTVVVHIKSGVHFSPPVDREVLSSDVAYAIERGANPHVANPYFKTYFSSLVGAEHARGGPIPGITTPDAHTIVFHLATPGAPFLVAGLALPLTAPVPQALARRYDSDNPSRYAYHQASTGPYMFKSTKTGRILGVGYTPGRSAVLVRNPNWRAATDFRPAYLSSIEIRVDAHEASEQRVLAGASSAENHPPISVVGTAYRRRPRQLQISPGAGVDFVTVDNKQGPFADSDVRKAFWAALDRSAMSRAAGHSLTAQVASHFLYPEIPGSSDADMQITGRGLLYNQDPQGNMAIARRYMRHAGYKSGRFTGRQIVLVVGVVGQPTSTIALLANRALHALGFKTRLLLTTRSEMVDKYCGAPAMEIDVCPNMTWHAEVGDPEAVLGSTFNGNTIRARGNDNWGQVDEPDLNSAIERESTVIERRAREQSWADVDNGLTGNAVAIPYAWLSGVGIESGNVAGVGELWNDGAWDFSFSSLT